MEKIEQLKAEKKLLYVGDIAYVRKYDFDTNEYLHTVRVGSVIIHQQYTTNCIFSSKCAKVFQDLLNKNSGK